MYSIPITPKIEVIFIAMDAIKWAGDIFCLMGDGSCVYIVIRWLNFCLIENKPGQVPNDHHDEPPFFRCIHHGFASGNAIHHLFRHAFHRCQLGPLPFEVRRPGGVGGAGFD